MKAHILVYGKHPEILKTVLRLIEDTGQYTASGSTDRETLEGLARTQTPDLLLLGGGVPREEELALRESFQMAFPATRIVQHFGGGSGLLFSEIREALAR